MSAPDTIGSICVKEENTKELSCACKLCSLITSESVTKAFEFLDEKFPPRDKK